MMALRVAVSPRRLAPAPCAHLVELRLQGVQPRLQRRPHSTHIEYLVQVLLVRGLQLLPQPCGERVDERHK